MKATESVIAKLTLLYPSGRILINDNDEHYKFYVIDKATEKIYYGRIGSKHRVEPMRNYNNDLYIEQKVREKINKGYREI